MGVYTLCSEHPVWLALIGFLFSLPCFWFTVAKPKYVQASRFVLLTYNLTCLYWYAGFNNFLGSGALTFMLAITRATDIRLSLTSAYTVQWQLPEVCYGPVRSHASGGPRRRVVSFRMRWESE